MEAASSAHPFAVRCRPVKSSNTRSRLYSFSNVFKAGHRIQLELACNEPFGEAHAQLLPPDSYHLPSGRATAHKIYRDAAHPSHLLLPVIPS